MAQIPGAPARRALPVLDGCLVACPRALEPQGARSILLGSLGCPTLVPQNLLLVTSDFLNVILLLDSLSFPDRCGTLGLFPGNSGSSYF